MSPYSECWAGLLVGVEIHKEITALVTPLVDRERICYCIVTLPAHTIAEGLCCIEVVCFEFTVLVYPKCVHQSIVTPFSSYK